MISSKEKLRTFVKTISKLKEKHSKLSMDKAKAEIIELSFSVVYAISIGLLIIPEYFITGLTLNIFAVSIIVLTFFLESKENEE